MALDTTDRDPNDASAKLGGGASTTSRPADSDSALWQERSAAVQSALSRWWSTQPIPRWLSGSLGRRIFAANLTGLIGLFLALLYLSLNHSWLVDAKIDVVRTISRVTAEAIAYQAVNERAVFDSDRIPDRAQRRFLRDDAFAAHQLPLEPHGLAVVLRKLVGPTETSARVYSNTGTLIIDTETLFSTGETTPPPEASDGGNLKLKNFWTRFYYWLNNKELKVYRDLGTANGFAYPEVKTAAQKGTETPMMLINSSGEQIVAMAEPISRGNRVLGVLFVATKPGDIDAVLWEERLLLFQIAGSALLFAIITALLLTRSVAGPMNRLANSARMVSQNIRSHRDLPDFRERRDEIGQMGRAFVAMTRALSRRIESSEKFAADVAHELKNPLAAARSMAESLHYAKSDEQREQLVAEVTSELKRLNRLINDVSSASRLDAELARQQLKPVDVRAVLQNISEMFTDMLRDDGRELRLTTDQGGKVSDYTVLGNDLRLGQVFTNLIDNALSFSPAEGVVHVRAGRRGDLVQITIEDQGPGIPADKLTAIFDRFYSDRPKTDRDHGKNSGLGLSISREIIVSHNGKIFAENMTEGDGTTVTGARFVVRLPVSGAIGTLTS